MRQRGIFQNNPAVESPSKHFLLDAEAEERRGVVWQVRGQPVGESLAG